MIDDSLKIKRQLFDTLKAYYPDKDFVGGVVSNTHTDTDRLAIIDYIENGEDVSVENIILMSLDLKIEKGNL